MEEIYNSLSRAVGKEYADNIWGVIVTRSHPSHSSSGQPDAGRLKDFDAIFDLCQKRGMEISDLNERCGNLELELMQVAQREREKVLEIISRGKSALDELESDGWSTKTIRAKRDVLGWVEQEVLRQQQGGAGGA
jgi:hypothetical protein